MTTPLPDHYATLGLDRSCTESQIRTAYRLLAKQLHPDVNQGSFKAITQTQSLNAAYEILSDPDKKMAYDIEIRSREKRTFGRSKPRQNISQNVFLRIEECLRGLQITICINDPANQSGTETYGLVVPPATAPGAIFRLPRAESAGGGIVSLRIKVRPDFRFKIRGSDLRCDLRVSLRRATHGGTEMITTANGSRTHVQIPRGIERNEIIRIAGEGLPKLRGGRGDLLVRVIYRPEVKFKRST